MARFDSLNAIPPMRGSPFEPDGYDEQRIAYVQAHWKPQDEPLRKYERQVEENIRMLCGQQWSVWSDRLGRFIDITRLMTDEERRWRQRPAINRLLYWYIVTHARLTENQPIITFRPGPDRIDAMLAEAMDTVFKTVWQEVAMTDRIDRLMAWLIPGAQAFLQTRVDPNKGDTRRYMGPAMLQLVRPDGSTVDRIIKQAPYDQDGTPLVELTPDGMGYNVTGEPYSEKEGALVVDVMGPLECRGEWNPRPWFEKRWHMHRSYLTQEEVFDLYQMWVEPDVRDSDTEGHGELYRMLFGSGYYGAASARAGSEFSTSRQTESGLVRVDTLWKAPSKVIPEMEENDQSPGGRLLVVTKNKVLRDSVRPAWFKYTSPIRCFEFVHIPGRPRGSTPQEAMNPLQQTYNRGTAQILEHRNLATNPKAVVDLGSGIKENQITNRPGEILFANARTGIKAFDYVAPPNISMDVWRTQDWLKTEFKELGVLEGTEGKAPTKNAPAELVRELRFNADRYLGPTVKRAVEEFARLAEDWIAWLPMIWDTEKIVSYAGEDNVARTVMVLPEMFSTGKVNVVPDLESMLPESRSERQARISLMYQEGLFGPIGTPAAVNHYLELARFPHLGRAVRPGGIHRVTAEQENGRLVQGEPAQSIYVFEWYDNLTHLAIHEEFMASPEYLKLDIQTQQQFVVHRVTHILAEMAKAANAMQTEQNVNDQAPQPPEGAEEETEEGPPSPTAVEAA